MPLYSQYDVPDSNQMVNLGVGQPSTKDLPLEWFTSTLQEISSTLKNPEFLQYGSIPGYDSVREKLSNWLSSKYKNQNKILTDHLFMTNGNTGGLQLLMDVYIETGDEIIIEDPSYFLARNMFDEFGLNINSVPMEDDGINIEILEETIIKIINNDVKNLQSKIFLYTIPIHHNPSSITLSKHKRVKLANLCKKYPKFHVIADEVYHFLSFNEIDEYSLADYHSKIFSLGSFSKILSPGLRVGWIYQNNTINEINLLDRLNKSAILDSSGGINPLGYLLIENAISSGRLDKMINKNIKTLSEKSQLIYDFITSQQTDIEVKNPKGGYFLWLKLNLLDTTDFLDFAIKFKVKFHPGYKFGETCKNYIRLSCSYYDQDDIILGLSRLCEAYKLYKKIKVSICGFNGKLGSLVVNEINKNDNFHFLNGISKNITIDNLCNVILDVSSNTGTYNLVNYLLINDINKPLLIGTTGLKDQTISLIKTYSLNNPVGIISNFSEGISKIKNLIKNLNDLSSNWDFSMIEKHHIHKKDSPSGTAKSLKNEIIRDCDIISVREGEIIGFHEIKIETEDEEIIISHNAKTRNIFAKGCLNYLTWIINKDPGIYYEMETNKYYISKILNNTYLITDNEKFKDSIFKDKHNYSSINFIIFIQDDNWIIYNLFGKTVIPDNNDYLLVTKYLYNIKNKTEGLLPNEISFKIIDNQIIFTINNIPDLYDLKIEESDGLTSLISQLSGITTLGISKYIYKDDRKNYLIIDIKENINDIESEIFSSLSSIINSEKKNNNYIICFINILESNNIRCKVINKNLKLSDCNLNSAITIFEYYALFEELSYDNNIEITIIDDGDKIKVEYDSESEKWLVTYKNL